MKFVTLYKVGSVLRTWAVVANLLLILTSIKVSNSYSVKGVGKRFPIAMQCVYVRNL